MTERQTVEEYCECVLDSTNRISIEDMISYLQFLKDSYSGKDVFLQVSQDSSDFNEISLYELRPETDEEMQTRINRHNTWRLNCEISDLTTKFLTGNLPQEEYIAKTVEIRQKYYLGANAT